MIVIAEKELCKFLYHIEVWLDGELNKFCYAASDTHNWAIVYKVDSNNKPILENNNLQLEKIYGKVEFVGKTQEAIDWIAKERESQING